MSVLALTIFVGVVLVAFFVVMFLHEVGSKRGVNERDALLPLAVEKPATTKTPSEPSQIH